jgi:hypothetical protein
VTEQQAAHAKPKASRAVRIWIIALVVVCLVEGIVIFAMADPFGANKPNVAFSPGAQVSASPGTQVSRPAYQFPSNSDQPVPATQQCPDAGSVAAGKGDNKTEIAGIADLRTKPLLLLGPNRRVVIGPSAKMMGSVTVCGDGGTVLIIGAMEAPVLMRGNGVKLVVQDGGKELLPPTYSVNNGQVLQCSTKPDDPEFPACDNYVPRPQPKPSD